MQRKFFLVALFLLFPFMRMMGQVTFPVTPAKAASAAKVPSRPPVGTKYVYETIAGREMSLYVVSPEGEAAGKKRPAMLFFHGGAWVGGFVYEFDRQVEYLADRGIVGIQVDYRYAEPGLHGSINPSIQDSKSAIRWVRSHAALLGVDPNRVGAAGGSAGGQLAAFLGIMDGENNPGDDLSVSFRPDLMVLFNPAMDLGPDGCCAGRVRDDYKTVSPIYHVHSGIPPTLVMQGDADKLVSPKSIIDFANEMKQAGNECTLVMYPGVGHGFFNAKDDFYGSVEQMDRFLAAHGWLQGPPDETALRKLPPKPLP
jgi:acetyl esterase